MFDEADRGPMAVDESADRDLSRRLEALPTEAAVPDTIWDTVARRISASGDAGSGSRTSPRRRGWRPSPWLQAAAGVVLFAGGVAAGLLAVREAPAPASRMERTLALAAEVQRTGSEYVAALSAFTAAIDSMSRDVRVQGTDAGFVTFLGAARHLALLEQHRYGDPGEAPATIPHTVRF